MRGHPPHCPGDGVNCPTHKKRLQTDWRTADSSVMHDVLLVLPQHCQQQVTAPRFVSDRGDARGLGTHGQFFWKAAKNCWSCYGRVSTEPQWTVGPVASRSNNGHFWKSWYFQGLSVGFIWLAQTTMGGLGVMMMMVRMKVIKLLSAWQRKVDSTYFQSNFQCRH